MNPLFNLLGGGNAFQNTPMGNMMNFMQSFQQFRNSFHGNAQQQIQNMLSSGQITQEQYNQAVQKAQQLQRFFNGQ